MRPSGPTISDRKSSDNYGGILGLHTLLIPGANENRRSVVGPGVRGQVLEMIGHYHNMPSSHALAPTFFNRCKPNSFLVASRTRPFEVPISYIFFESLRAVGQLSCRQCWSTPAPSLCTIIPMISGQRITAGERQLGYGNETPLRPIPTALFWFWVVARCLCGPETGSGRGHTGVILSSHPFAKYAE